MSTITECPHYIAVDPDGTHRPVDPSYAGIKDGVHNATIDAVQLGDGWHTLYVDDEGMLVRARLNVPASIFAGRPLYGPVVLTGGTDDEGETMLPHLQAANVLMTFAQMWKQVEENTAAIGQDIAVYADPDSLPSPEVVSLTDEEFAAWLEGDTSVIAKAAQREREEGS